MKGLLSHLRGWFLVWVLIGHGSSLSASPVPEPAHGTSFSPPLFADFDEDRRPDLALGRYEPRGYRIEVHLSRSRVEVLLDTSLREWGLLLLALDLNGDAHSDLVLASAHCVRPRAIWFGDGHGGFRRSRARGITLALLNTAGYTTASVRDLDLSLGAEDRWPLESPPEKVLWKGVEIREPLPFDTTDCPQAFHLISRGIRSPPEAFQHAG